MNELFKQTTVLAGQKNSFGMQTQISTTIDCLSVKPINSISVGNANQKIASWPLGNLLTEISVVEQIGSFRHVFKVFNLSDLFRFISNLL